MGAQPDFHCGKCGKELDFALDPPSQALCEDCCEDHDYVYEAERRAKFCRYCDKQSRKSASYLTPPPLEVVSEGPRYVVREKKRKDAASFYEDMQRTEMGL